MLAAVPLQAQLAPPPASPEAAATLPAADVPPPVVSVPQDTRDTIETAVPAQAPVPPDQPTSDEVVVTGRTRTGDPLQDVNVAAFDATQGVDDAVVGPAAKAYKKRVPKPFRTGLRNFLNNLREPVVFVNYLIQIKPGKAAQTLGRFAVNSTVGVAGLIDVAKKKPFFLPRRRNGFANTLGFYGVKPGPFFFLPLIGPTTLRDLIGNVADQAVPIGPIRPLRGAGFTIPVAVLSALDYRAEFDGELERQRATADPYAAARKYYLERRQAEIDQLRGRKKGDRPAPVSPAPAAAAAPAQWSLVGPPA